MSVTITSLYDDRAAAEAAVSQLQSRAPDGRFRIIAGTGDADEKGLWASLKEAFLPYEDRSLYGEGISRGSYLLHAEVEESDADEVCGLLEQSGPIDMVERERSWRSEGWEPGAGSDETQARSNAPVAGGQPQPDGSKRQVERGGARVRSYVREEPVHKTVEDSVRRTEVGGDEHRSDGERSASAVGDPPPERSNDSATEEDFASGDSTRRRDDSF